MTLVKRVFRGIGTFLLLIGLATLFTAGGLFLATKSFDELSQARQLDRYISPQIAGVLPGPAILNGVAEGDEPFSSRQTDDRCLYYSRVTERRRTNSDGDSYWESISHDQKIAPFSIGDSSGQIQVVPDENVESFVGRKISEETLSQGRRAIEYCISAGMDITVQGVVRSTPTGHYVGFEEDARFGSQILASRQDWDRMHASLGSFFFLILSLVLLSFAAWFLTGAFRLHQLPIFLATQTLLMLAVLTWLGWTLTIQELDTNADNIAEALHAAESAIAELLGPAGQDWQADWNTPLHLDDPAFSDLSEDEAQRIRTIRTNAAEQIIAAQRFQHRPPQIFVALALGYEKIPPISLTESEEEIIRTPRFGSGSGLRFRDFLKFGVVLFVFAPIFTFLGFRRLKQLRAAQYLPTTDVQGVTFGLTEIAGIVVPDPGQKSLSSPVRRSESVYISDGAIDQRIYQRMGENQQPGTITPQQGLTKGVPFWCEDETGRILIDPVGADVLSRHMEKSGPNLLRILKVGDPVYILGSAKINPHNHELYIGCTEDRDIPFLLSNWPEKTVHFKLGRSGTCYLALGLSTTTGLFLGFLGAFLPFSPVIFFLACLSVCAYMAMVPVVFAFNDLVTMRRRVRRNWANIEVALKKRFDVITNLQEVVRSYLQHEDQLQAAMAELRAGHNRKSLTPAASEDILAREAQLTRRFMGLFEDHPELRAQQLVADLSAALEATEKDIALMRKGYNNAVEFYNTRRSRIPDLLLAVLFGFKPASHFKPGGGDDLSQRPS